MLITLNTGKGYQDRPDPAQTQWMVELDGAVIVDDGHISAVGPANQLLALESNLGTVVDVEGRAVVPGFIDCHTHLPFAGWRADEYLERLQGASHESLSEKSGPRPIQSTVGRSHRCRNPHDDH